MDFNKIFQSKIFKIILWCIAGLIIFLLIFKIGMMVGFKKANFSYQWGENYHKNFAGPREGLFRDFSNKDFIGGHGVFGQIMKIDGALIILKGSEQAEKIVLVKDDTVIVRFRDNIKLSDLKIDEYITVIGSPDNAGQIEAKFIRALPSPKEDFRQSDRSPRPMNSFFNLFSRPRPR